MTADLLGLASNMWNAGGLEASLGSSDFAAHPATHDTHDKDDTHDMPELRRERDKAIQCGWIQHSRSNFGSPVLSVPKPDGTLYMCIHYRAVNSITVKDGYPLPHIADVLNSMHGSCLFTKRDLAAGSHQICIATANTQKTAFTSKTCPRSAYLTNGTWPQSQTCKMCL
jgi:hypothetical protein